MKESRGSGGNNSILYGTEEGMTKIEEIIERICVEDQMKNLG